MKSRSTNWPSFICRSGRRTALKSIWPHGCGMYHAAVRSGACDLNGLTGAARAQVEVDVEVAVAPLVTVVVMVAVQVDSAGFCVVASDPTSPAVGVQPS